MHQRFSDLNGLASFEIDANPIVMPIGSPFHERTSRLCTSYRWKDWGGYHAVCSFDTTHDREYYAFRHSVGMIDVTPLYKYEVRGPEAASFLARVLVKDPSKMKTGVVTYLCWCDDDGKVVDDGTVTRLAEDWFRVTAAEPSYSWFSRFSRRYDVTIEDSSNQLAALAVQGPNARALLQQVCDAGLNQLKFFRHTQARFEGGFDAEITRTGYTGDLGYEVWVSNRNALALYDALKNRGRAYGLESCGLDALDVTRVEAGFIMNGVDYHSAHHCLSESRKSNPWELNLGRTVQLNRDPFIGQEALKRAEKAEPVWMTVGLATHWEDFEALHHAEGLPPSICTMASREAVPIYDQDRVQVGYATSRAWSPILKQNLVIATIQARSAEVGTELMIETTVEFKRQSIRATVQPMPFFNPERKRSLI